MGRDRRRLLLGLSALLASSLARAQRRPRARVGILVVGDPEPFFGHLKHGLRAAGYVEGRDFDFLLRSALGNSDALAPLARELASIKPDVIVALQTPAAHAVKDATSTIPIVILAGDPVGTGLVKSLARPGGHVTGISATTQVVGGKLLELVREILPAAQRVAVLANAADPFTRPFLEHIEAPAEKMALRIHTVRVRGRDDYDAAFAEFVAQKVDALIVQPSLPRESAARLALRHRLPALAPTRAFPEAGGLFSYSANNAELYRGTAEYVVKILRGAKPADLPMQQPTKFELVVNAKTAKALGVTIPRSVLLRADHIIE